MSRAGAAKDRQGTKQRQKEFLDEFAKLGVVTAAAERSGVYRRTVYNWLDRDADFAEAYDSALEEANDRLEQEARRRAVDGVEDVVGVTKDGEVIVRRVYSDRLLELLLKGHRPRLFRDRVEHTGANGGPITFADLASAARDAGKADPSAPA